MRSCPQHSHPASQFSGCDFSFDRFDGSVHVIGFPFYFIINISFFNFYDGNVAPVGKTLKSSKINSAVLVGCR